MKERRSKRSLDPSAILFPEKTFCFTGKLADVKRSQAAEAVRARRGLSVDVVNASLDYLVIGSIPSTGWKHGSYGTKIERALELTSSGGRPALVPEDVFVRALVLTPAEQSGAIDAKMVVCSFEFVAAGADAFDGDGLLGVLADYRMRMQGHLSIRSFPVSARRGMYDDENLDGVPGDWCIYLCRLISQLPLGVDAKSLASALEDDLKSVRGVERAGFSYIERAEGTASYAKLLKDMPEELRIPGI